MIVECIRCDGRGYTLDRDGANVTCAQCLGAGAVRVLPHVLGEADDNG